MPARHRKRGPMHDINVVPYIDVMLVLLVIFMVAAPLITPSVIDLPTVGKARQPRVRPAAGFVTSANHGDRVRRRAREAPLPGQAGSQKSPRAPPPGLPAGPCRFWG